MAKYFTYEGKQVGFVRKMIDDVIMIEEAWISEINKHFAKRGYDPLLSVIGRILQEQGHPPISRAQVWVVLDQLTSEGVPHALRDHEADVDVDGSTSWLSRAAKTTVVAGAEVVDTVVTKPVAAVASKVLPDKGEDEVVEDEDEDEVVEDEDEVVEDEGDSVGDEDETDEPDES